MPATYTDAIDGLTTSLAVKAPVIVATTANIALSGEQTVNGVAVVPGDRILVKDQTDTTENGIYVVSSSSWVRARDFDGARDVVKGTAVRVASDDLTDGTLYIVTTSNPITIGSSSITFETRGSLSGSDLDGALVTDNGVQRQIQTAISNRPVMFESTQALLLEDLTGYDRVGAYAFYTGWNADATIPLVDIEYRREYPAVTGTASTLYADNSGFYDANGDGFRLSRQQRHDLYMFGAAMDGVTDDSDAFAAALSYASANKRKLFIPGATARIETAPTGLGGVVIVGEGSGNSVLEFVDQTWGHSHISDFSIERVKIRNNGTVNVLSFEGSSKIRVEECILEQDAAANVNTAPLRIADSATQGGKDYWVINNIFKGTIGGSIFQGGASRWLENITVKGNQYFGDNVHALSTVKAQPLKIDYYCKNFEVNGNLFYDELGTKIDVAISVEETVENGIVANNIIYNTGGGIRIYDGQTGSYVKRLRVSGNIMFNLTDFGGSNVGNGHGVSIAGDGANPHEQIELEGNQIYGCVIGFYVNDGSIHSLNIVGGIVVSATQYGAYTRGDRTSVNGLTVINATLNGLRHDSGSDAQLVNLRMVECAAGSLRVFQADRATIRNITVENTNSVTNEVQASGGGGGHHIDGIKGVSSATNLVMLYDGEGIGTEIGWIGETGAAKKLNYNSGNDAVPQLEISAGAITITNKKHKLWGEASAVDDLTDIAGGWGKMVILVGNGSHNVTVKNGVGNIELAGSDFTLTSYNDRLVLGHDIPTDTWCEISRSDNS